MATSIILLAILAPAVVALATLGVLYHVLTLFREMRGDVTPRKKLFIRKAESTSTPSLVQDLKDTPLAGPDGVTHVDKKPDADYLPLEQIPKEDAMKAMDKLTGRDKLFQAIEDFEAAGDIDEA